MLALCSPRFAVDSLPAPGSTVRLSLPAAAVVWVLFASSSPAAAQTDGNAPPVRRPARAPAPVNLIIRAGLDGFAMPGRPTPVRVTCVNQGEAVDGRLELRDGDRVVTTRVKLPPSARQEYTLLLPPDWAHEDRAMPTFDLRLLHGRKEVALEEVGFQSLRNGLLIGAATGEGSGVQFLSGMEGVHVGTHTQADLPRTWVGYLAADVWLLTGRVWAGMDEDQRKAFRTWLEQGGRAVLTGDKQAEWKDPIGRRIAGVNPEREVALPELSAFSVWDCPPYRARGGGILSLTGRPNPGVVEVLREGRHPVMVERHVVDGRVVWLGFDPFQANLRDGWPGFPDFVRRLVDRLRPPASQWPSAFDPEQLKLTVQAMPRLPSLPPWMLAAFGVTYIAIFGPINLWVLRRMRRTVRAWLFMPGLSLGMTLVVLLIGQAWGNGRIVLNSVTVLRAAAGSSTAVEECRIGLFSPTNRSFDFTVEDPAGALTDEQPEVEDPPWPTWQEEGQCRWEAVPMQLYSVRLLGLRRPVDLDGVVEYREPRRGRAEVRNATRLRLTDCRLRRQGQEVTLGDLPPGAALPVPERWTRPQPPSAGAADFAGRVRELLHSPPAGLSLPHPVLVGFVPDHAPGLTVAGIPFSNRATLVEITLPPPPSP